MKLRLTVICIIIQLLFSVSAGAQNYCFQQINGIDLKGGYLGFASWVDYNADGWMDVFVTGEDFGSDFQHAMLYKNNGNKTFSDSKISNIPRVIYGSSAWGDYNNDGFPDLLYSGTKSGFAENNITQVYKNDGKGNFTEIVTPVAQVDQSDVKWVDANNDGRLDIFLMGINTSLQLEIELYKNNGHDAFEKTDVPFAQLQNIGGFAGCKAQWADFDNDGLTDVLIYANFSVKCYRNFGNFNFKEVKSNITYLNNATLAVADINQDGRTDVVIAGENNLMNYINQSNFKFESVQAMPFVNGNSWKNIELADYSNDGYPDLIFYGNGYDVPLAVLENQKNNTFSATGQSIGSNSYGGACFGDINNDNHPDILYFGRKNYPEEEVTYVYENTISLINLRPGAPTGLKVVPNNNDINFTWDAANDDNTKAGSLNYNIRIGTKNNRDSLVSSNSTNSKLTYYHRGNAGMKLNYNFRNFPEGVYKVAVQSIDNAFNVSDFSGEVDFCFRHSKGVFKDTLSIAEGDSILLDPGPGYKNYTWNNQAETREVYAKMQGLYNVLLVDSNNCISSEAVYVKTNNSSANIYDFSFQPNPVQAAVKLNYSFLFMNKYLWLEILDSKGNVVLKKNYDVAPFSDILDLSDLQHGLYFIRLRSESEYRVQKFIKVD